MDKEKKYGVWRFIAWCGVVSGAGLFFAHCALWSVQQFHGRINHLDVPWRVAGAFTVIGSLVILRIYRITSRMREQQTVSNPYLDDYDQLMRFFMHADVLNWNRLYYFLVFNSIIIAGWVTLYSVAPDSAVFKQYVLIGLSLLGLMLSILWSMFAIPRGIAFQNYYDAWARLIEQKDPKKQLHQTLLRIQYFFARGAPIHFIDLDTEKVEDKDKQIPWYSRTLGAREVMEGVPWLFAAAYFLLLCVSYIVPNHCFR